jgi:hypothetical protein
MTAHLTSTASRRVFTSFWLFGLGYALELLVGLFSFDPSWYQSRVTITALSFPPSAAATELSRQPSLGLSFYDSLAHTTWWWLLVSVWAIQGLAVLLWRMCAVRTSVSWVVNTTSIGALGCCLFVVAVISERIFYPPHNGAVLTVDRGLGYRAVLDVLTGAAGYVSLGCLVAAACLTATGFGLTWRRARFAADSIEDRVGDSTR